MKKTARNKAKGLDNIPTQYFHLERESDVPMGACARLATEAVEYHSMTEVNRMLPFVKGETIPKDPGDYRPIMVWSAFRKVIDSAEHHLT